MSTSTMPTNTGRIASSFIKRTRDIAISEAKDALSSYRCFCGVLILLHLLGRLLVDRIFGTGFGLWEYHAPLLFYGEDLRDYPTASHLLTVFSIICLLSLLCSVRYPNASIGIVLQLHALILWFLEIRCLVIVFGCFSFTGGFPRADLNVLFDLYIFLTGPPRHRVINQADIFLAIVWYFAVTALMNSLYFTLANSYVEEARKYLKNMHVYEILREPTKSQCQVCTV